MPLNIDHRDVKGCCSCLHTSGGNYILTFFNFMSMFTSQTQHILNTVIGVIKNKSTLNLISLLFMMLDGFPTARESEENKCCNSLLC